MKIGIAATFMGALFLCGSMACAVEPKAPVAKIPIIYSTDLTHPHMDPDDHYDLACLYAMSEFEIKGIILDMGELQAKIGEGRPAVEQMMHITGQKAPCVVGLSHRLRSRDDKVLDDDKKFQGGVELIISVLRESKEKVLIMTVGSCRDVAAAFNREPELLKEKVLAVYFNIGIGPNQAQNECNVNYDFDSYVRMFETGLPLYWAPCFGQDGFGTHYQVDQPAVVAACAPVVRNFFIYALTKPTAAPIEFLANTVATPVPVGPRHMWCTAPMFHAAGRKIYQRGENDFIALSPADAEKAGLADKAVEVFEFMPMVVKVTAADPTQEKLVVPEPGKLSAAWVEGAKDRLGTNKLAKDGQPDCDVAILGVPADKTIKNLLLTTKGGRWEQIDSGKFWLVISERQAEQLHCYFSYYREGEHQIEIVYDDGSSQTVSFTVPNLAGFHVDLKPTQPNGFVFHTTDKHYADILASCLKNLLAGFGR